jgi:hypothetical protein
VTQEKQGSRTQDRQEKLGRFKGRILPRGGWRYVGAIGEPAFENSWVNFDASGLAEMRFVKDGSGVVHLEGVVKSGTVPSAIFTLPEGFRPEFRTIWNQITSGGVGRIDIYEADHVSQAGEVYMANGSNAWIGVNISFYIGG